MESLDTVSNIIMSLFFAVIGMSGLAALVIMALFDLGE